MHGMRAGVVLLLACAGGCTFGTYPLPEAMEVRATGQYAWSPIPYAEAGVYYDFIGVGWLMHDQRGDALALFHQGRRVAIARHTGQDGWDLTLPGRQKVATSGWCVGGYEDTLLVGVAPLVPAPPAPEPPRREHFAPGLPYLNAPNETHYLYRWAVRTEPARTLGEKPDRAVFLLDGLDYAYLRLVTFTSSRYTWQGARILPGRDDLPGGSFVRFRLRDRRTGRAILVAYPYGGPEPRGRIWLQPQATKPTATPAPDGYLGDRTSAAQLPYSPSPLPRGLAFDCRFRLRP